MIFFFDILIIVCICFLVLRKGKVRKKVRVPFLVAIAVSLSLLKPYIMKNVILKDRGGLGNIRYHTTLERSLKPYLFDGAALFYPVWSYYYKSVSESRSRLPGYLSNLKLEQEREKCLSDQKECMRYLKTLSLESVKSELPKKHEDYLRENFLDKSIEAEITCNTISSIRGYYGSALSGIGGPTGKYQFFNERYYRKIYSLVMNCEPSELLNRDTLSELGYSASLVLINKNKEKYENISQRVCLELKSNKICEKIKKLK